MSEPTRQPIGVFDSGVGGLTVFKEIRRRFPHEDIVYFGDTARVPYGPKSRETVIRYSIQNAQFLAQLGAKIIVIACNTSASVAIPALTKRFMMPMVGVIEPGAIAAVRATRNNRVGVIGTEGTVKSDAYRNEILKRNPDIDVTSQPCPLFVPLAEEGWVDHPATWVIAQEYFSSLKGEGIDTLVLGCTHYPILKTTIQSAIGSGVTLVDSAEVTAQHLSEILPRPEKRGKGRDRFYVSDNEDKFRRIAERILDHPVQQLQKVIPGETWILDKQGA
jgi:glutamate racemase